MVTKLEEERKCTRCGKVLPADEMYKYFIGKSKPDCVCTRCKMKADQLLSESRIQRIKKKR